jgi:hypothetical protein
MSGWSAVAIAFPISAFVALGFEHCVANFYLLTIGLLSGAQITAAGYASNIAFVTAGNTLCGGYGACVTVPPSNLRHRSPGPCDNCRRPAERWRPPASDRGGILVHRVRPNSLIATSRDHDSARAPRSPRWRRQTLIMGRVASFVRAGSDRPSRPRRANRTATSGTRSTVAGRAHACLSPGHSGRGGESEKIEGSPARSLGEGMDPPLAASHSTTAAAFVAPATRQS